MRAVLTRDGDYFVPFRDRMRNARAQRTPTCSSRSMPTRSWIASVRGSSVYVLSTRRASSEAARMAGRHARMPRT